MYLGYPGRGLSAVGSEWYGREYECRHAAVIGGVLSDRIEALPMSQLARATAVGRTT